MLGAVVSVVVVLSVVGCVVSGSCGSFSKLLLFITTRDDGETETGN